MSNATGFYVTGKQGGNLAESSMGYVLFFAAFFLYFYIGGWKCGEWGFAFKLLAYIILTYIVLAGVIGSFIASLNCKDLKTEQVVTWVLGIPAYLVCAKLGAMWVW